MPLITVSTPDKPQKVFVMGDTVDALRKSAIEAFHLPPDESYEVCREMDGVMISSDEVLLFLSSSESAQGKNLEVSISPSTRKVAQEGTPTCAPTTSRNVLSSDNCRNSLVHPPLPMKNIAENLDPVLEVALHPEESDVTPVQFLKIKRLAVKETYQEVAKFIRKKVKDESFPTAKYYANLVLGYDGGKYSKLFELKVGSVVKSGISTFTLQIYNHLNYRKPDKKKRGPRRRLVENEVEDEDDVVPLPAEISSAAYGCVAYAVPLPPEETEDTQEKSRLELLSLDPESAESIVLMERTYLTQRATINRRKIKPKDVFDLWPLLKHRTFLLSHADRLLGKDVKNIWSQNLGEKCGRFSDFMLSHFAAEEKRKSTAKTLEMLALLKEKERVNGIFQHQMANSLALFPLLVAFNKESSNLLFRIMPAATTIEEVKEIRSENPLLVIRGESIFDAFVAADLVLSGEIVSAADPVDGFLLLIISYFVFGLKYPKNISSSLEFLQRLLLDINPEVGSRRETAPKEKNFIDPKVRHLTEQLTFFCSSWNVCRF